MVKMKGVSSIAVRLGIALIRVGVSSAPLIVIVTVWVVPSAVVIVKVSVWLSVASSC